MRFLFFALSAFLFFLPSVVKADAFTDSITSEGGWSVYLDEKFDNPTTFAQHWVFSDGIIYAGDKQYNVAGLGNNATLGVNGLTLTAKVESVGGKEYTSARIELNEELENFIWDYRVKNSCASGAYVSVWDGGYRNPTGYGELDSLEIQGQSCSKSSSGAILAVTYGDEKVWPRDFYQAFRNLPDISTTGARFTIKADRNLVNYYIDEVLVHQIERKRHPAAGGSLTPLVRTYAPILSLSVCRLVGGVCENPLTNDDYPTSVVFKYFKIWTK